MSMDGFSGPDLYEEVIESKDVAVEVDNSSSVLHKMATLYSEQLMSDITLVVGGRKYPAHRLILCATSDVFSVMLMNRIWTEFNESQIVLQETQSCCDVFPQFIDFEPDKTPFYMLLIHQDPDLIGLSLKYMLKTLALAAHTGQIVDWLQYTMACGHNEVASACKNLILLNFEDVAETTEFLNFDSEILMNLLQSSDLVVHNELTLYKLVDKWLWHQKGRIAQEMGLSSGEAHTHWLSLLTDTLQYIRFPMMCPRQLANLLLSPLTQEHKTFFVERMALAMSYQSGQEGGLANWLSHGNMKDSLEFTPRLYSEDNWGSLLTVDSFHNVPCYDMRTYIFSTRAAIAEKVQMEIYQDRMIEWTVDLYPKGVWFRKSRLITFGRIYDVPEAVLRTVRVAITCRDPPAPNIEVRVKIGILIWGIQEGVEHIVSHCVRVHRFTCEESVLNIDDALQFDDLNHPLYTPTCSIDHAYAQPYIPTLFPGHDCDDKTSSSYIPRHLIGPNRDLLKIQVIVMPLAHAKVHVPEDCPICFEMRDGHSNRQSQ